MSGSPSPFSALYAFGDSLSDAGNDSILTSATGVEPISPPYYHTNVSILDGTASESASVFSNGPVWVQDVSVALGDGTLEPSLLGGNDYAYGGSETGSEPQNSGNTTVAATSLPAQISEFNAVQGSISASALVTFSTGGNDIFDILNKPTLTATQQATDISDAVANEISAINSLAKDGAKNFLIFNVPNLGLVPEVTSGIANGSNTPSAALDSLATSLSQSYDMQLETALAADASSGGLSINVLDSYSLLNQAAADPSSFGLVNTTTPVWSGNFSSANSGTLAATSLAAQNQYLFWDDFHPTAGVHQIIADQALSVVDPTLNTAVTVTGASGGTLSLTLATDLLASFAQGQLTQISAAIAAKTAVANAVTNGSLPTLAAGITGLAEIDSGTFVALSAGYTTAIDLATGPVTLIGGTTANQFIVASGTGELTYAASAGVDTVYAGAGGALVFGSGAGLDFMGGTGASTIIGGSAGNTVSGGAGNELVFGSSSLNFIGGSGAATIIGGASGNTVTGAGGNNVVFASSSLTYTGAEGQATLIGGSGAVNANLGLYGGVAYGGVNGGNTLTSGSGTAVLVGGGTGDLLTATGAGNDVLVASGGAETLTGAGATGNLVLFGGSGPDSLAGGAGNDVIVAGSGNATLTGGGGTNAYAIFASPGTTRVDTITDFDPTRTAIGLFGFGAEPGVDAAALASATVTGSTTTVSLTDGTSIVFAGAPTLHSYNFF